MADRVQRAPSKQLFGPFNVKYLLDVGTSTADYSGDGWRAVAFEKIAPAHL